eukprot:gene17328-20761_t
MDGLDIDSDSADEIYLKEVVSKLFSIGDEVFFFFRNEEYFFDKNEFSDPKKRLFDRFNEERKFVFLYKIDGERFAAIGTINYSLETGDFIVDLWKYFMACSFFKPINALTFEKYQDYLECNGGIGGEALVVSYNSLELNLENLLQIGSDKGLLN